MPVCPIPNFHNAPQAINCLMKLYWIESRIANSADVVWLWTHSCSKNPCQQRHSDTHTFPAQSGTSQKFKAHTQLILNPTACTSKDVWVQFVYKERWQASCVALSAKCVEAGEELGVRVLYLICTDYSHWYGASPRGLEGKQPRPEKTRQTLMLSVELWISTFLGDSCITWFMGSRSYVCSELFNLENCSFDGAL